VSANEFLLCNILIVDDNQISGELVRLQLTRLGYHVRFADSGPKALDIISHEKIDIVLLDLRMPGMGGREVLERIRDQHSRLALPVIMVTADDQEQLIVECLQSGANDYLVKPLSIPVAVARINALVNVRNLSHLKDEFLSFASHDLKKPLIVMRDIIESLKNDIAAPNLKAEDIDFDDIHELLCLLHKSTTNMQDVVENFLDVESLNRDDAHRLKLKKLQINKIIKQALDSNQNYATSKQIRLQERLDQSLPEIELDQFYVSQILDNLIGNALKFSPPETETCVSTHQDKDFVYTEVTDAGPGLTESDMKKLFQRNTQLSNKPTGDESSSGIGLVLAKKLVEMHGGVIGARNNPGAGATFWFKLPIKQFETDADKVHTKNLLAQSQFGV